MRFHLNDYNKNNLRQTEEISSRESYLMIKAIDQ